MSVSSLLMATSDILRDRLSLSEKEVGIRQADGRPPAACGQEYIAISPWRWEAGPSPDQNYATDEYFGIQITVTRRAPYAPDDRMMEDIYLPLHEGMESRVRTINLLMATERYNILTRTKHYLSGNPFTEPLRWIDTDAMPTEVGDNWFQGTGSPISGYIMRSRYGQARRLQDFDDTIALELNLPTS